MVRLRMVGQLEYILTTPSSLHSIQQKNQGTSLSVLRLYLKVQQREILSLFRLVINSAFINEQKTNFRWEITPVKNRKLDVKYIDKDGGTEEQGEINVFPEGDERGDHIFYAVFTMPDCDVDVKFIVNEDGTNPEEDDLENNVASATIELVETFNNLEIINLPYDALSRDISFKLAGENEIKAQLRLPRGSWDGNAKGELKVTNEIMTYCTNLK